MVLLRNQHGDFHCSCLLRDTTSKNCVSSNINAFQTTYVVQRKWRDFCDQNFLARYHMTSRDEYYFTVGSAVRQSGH